MPKILDEKKLIEKTLAGDLSSFEEIVKHFQENILAHANKFLKDPSAAEDVTQDTFIKFYKTLRKFDKKRPIKPWLYKIATNLCLDFIRKNKKNVGLSWDIESTDESSLDRILRLERKRVVKDALEALPTIYKLPIMSHYFRNLSYKEISKALKLPLNTVRTRIKRGKELLAKELRKQI